MIVAAYTAGSEEVTVLVSGFPRRDTVTASIVEAFGPGNDYLMGSGQVNTSGALELVVGSADRPAIPENLEPGVWSVLVKGTRVPRGGTGPTVASAPLIVLAPSAEPTPVPGK